MNVFMRKRTGKKGQKRKERTWKRKERTEKGEKETKHELMGRLDR